MFRGLMEDVPAVAGKALFWLTVRASFTARSHDNSCQVKSSEVPCIMLSCPSQLDALDRMLIAVGAQRAPAPQ